MIFDISSLLNYDIEQSKTIGDSLLISQILKEKRTNLSLTLKESSEGICSISYLSKVEQRQLKPKKDVIEKLIKRYDISDNEIYFKTDKYNDILDKSIRDYLSSNILLNYYNVIFEENNYKSNLIKFAYAVSNEKLDIAYQIYQKLNHVIGIFNIKEIIYYFYFLADFLSKDNKNLLAYKLLDKIRNISIEDISEELKILVERLYIRSVFKIRRDADVLKSIAIFREQLAFYNLYEYIKDFDCFNLRFSIFKNDNKTNIKTINSKIGLTKNEKVILTSFSYYREAKYELALKQLGLIKNFDSITFLYYAALNDLTANTERAITFLNNYKENLNPLTNDLLEFLIAKTTLKPSEFFHFIISKYFRQKEIENYYYIEYIVKSSVDYFANLKFYKDIYLLYQEYDQFKNYLLYS